MPKNESIISKVFSTVICFALVSFAWIFFRANSISDAFMIVEKVFTEWGPLYKDISVFLYGFTALFILVIKDAKDAFGFKLNLMHSEYYWVRLVSVVLLISYIMLFGVLGGGTFIYFQF